MYQYGRRCVWNNGYLSSRNIRNNLRAFWVKWPVCLHLGVNISYSRPGGLGLPACLKHPHSRKSVPLDMIHDFKGKMAIYQTHVMCTLYARYLHGTLKSIFIFIMPVLRLSGAALQSQVLRRWNSLSNTAITVLINHLTKCWILCQ